MKKLLFLFLMSNSILFAQNTPNPPKNYFFGTFTGQGIENSEFVDVSMSGYDALNANVIFSDKDNTQKLVISPFKLANTQNYFWHGLKVNISHKKGESTAGLGYTWDFSSPSSKRGDKKWNEFVQIPEIKKKIDSINVAYPLKDAVLMNATDRAKRDKDKQKAFDNVTEDVRAEYYRKLIKNGLKLTFGANLGMFEVLGADDVDLDTNGLNDYEFFIKKNALSIGAVYNVNENIGFTFNFHYQEKRSSAEEKQILRPYVGWSAGGDVKICNLDKDYKKSEDYTKSFFIPQIRFGIGTEFIRCNAPDECEDAIRRRLTFNPYFDFKLKPKSQFRIGIPLNLTESSKNIPRVGVFFTYSLALTSIK
jgi:hypothetical protein